MTTNAAPGRVLTDERTGGRCPHRGRGPDGPGLVPGTVGGRAARPRGQGPDDGGRRHRRPDLHPARSSRWRHRVSGHPEGRAGPPARPRRTGRVPDRVDPVAAAPTSGRRRCHGRTPRRAEQGAAGQEADRGAACRSRDRHRRAARHPARPPRPARPAGVDGQWLGVVGHDRHPHSIGYYRRDGRFVPPTGTRRRVRRRERGLVLLPSNRRKNRIGITDELPTWRTIGWNVAFLALEACLVCWAHFVAGVSWTTIGLGFAAVVAFGVALITYVVKVAHPPGNPTAPGAAAVHRRSSASDDQRGRQRVETPV